MTNPEQGLSLLDIGPQYELVLVGDKQLRVYGVSAEGVLALFQRFPDIQTWFKGGKADFRAIVPDAPHAVTAVIAAGCGYPGNAAAETVAATYAVETQLDILEAIGRLTFKNGFGPFVKRLTALAAVAQSVKVGRVSVTKSPQESST